MSTDLLASPVATSAAPSPRRARRPLVVLIAVLTLLGTGTAGGWVAARQVESPAQRAAAAAAPAPSPVLAQVSRGTLAQRVTASAAVENAGSHTVSLALPSAGRAVVTGQNTAPGTTVAAGQAVLSINGRPVLALPGVFPNWRDLREGDTGPDVAQLQDGLRQAGQQIRTSESGTFGTATVAAIRALYRAAGSAPSVETTQVTDSAHPDLPTLTQERMVVPASEILPVTGLPAVLTAAPPVGSVLDPSNATITLAAPQLHARAQVAASVLAAFETAPPKASLTDQQGTKSIAVNVGAVTQGDATTGAPGTVELIPTEGTLPADWAGQQLLATFDLQVVATDALIVPTIAVAQDGTGALTVTRLDASGQFSQVQVREIGTLNGQSAITPVASNALRQGDQVRVD